MVMKLHFEPNLQFQIDAIESVTDLFRGQEISRSEFTVTSGALDGVLAGIETDLGIGNRLALLDDEIHNNLVDIQIRNGLAPSASLASRDFTVEMETGTGKTYVYLRTILELRKQYGFSKFVIVVPSIAIKEGVYKSLQITEDHYKGLYSGEPYNYFLYDSKKLGDVRSFATSSQIQIMVMTVGAINKRDVNNIYKESEKTGGERPIDLIRATNPIIIVDEPQSVDGGLSGRGREALSEMNPLCTLRYSATHVDKHHMTYRLDAVDAYQRKLVKQIEVAGANVEGGQNKPYVRLTSTSNRGGTISASVELDVETRSGRINRATRNVTDGDDLEQVTGRSVYADHRIGEISVGDDAEYIELRGPGDEIWLSVGDSHGDVDELAVDREMIRRTIDEHLIKQMRLADKGIKVLSLFFIPRVDLYRQYDPDTGEVIAGDYVTVFEEEYRRAAKKPNVVKALGAANLPEPSLVHDGYFSIDRKRIGGQMREFFTDTSGATLKDETAYNLIMKDKERLLSTDVPLQFIFSHSALREGWDNPNVFQICTLRDIKSERQRRQTIGRGLRLAVNQDGKRQHGFAINTLTVVARDGYERFAEDLQKEIQEDTGITFGIVDKHEFAACKFKSDTGQIVPLGTEKSEELWAHLHDQEMIDDKGRVTDALRVALPDDVEIPPGFEPYSAQILGILTRLAGSVEVKNADERRTVSPRRAVLDSEEFRELWDRVKFKTTYRVHFDNEKLVSECIDAVKAMAPVPRATVRWEKATIEIDESGVSAKSGAVGQTRALDEQALPLPDILTDLQDRTALTRRSIYRIIVESERLDDFKKNPQLYIAKVADSVNRRKRVALVDGIKYQRLGESDYYAQELFEAEELTGYITNMLQDAERSVYEDVIVDSQVERRFAEQLENREGVKVYAKLPSWFTVPTPLGSYNPDWAVLIDTNDGEKLYFVVETKGSIDEMDLRVTEHAKIKCGEAHFAALEGVAEPPVEFVKATSLDDVLARVN